MFVCGKCILYIQIGITLASLLVSNLYLSVSILWLLFVFNFGIMVDLML